MVEEENDTLTLEEEVYDKADETLQQLISRLPPEIREKAENIPCHLDDKDPDGYRVLGRCMALGRGPIMIYVGQIFELEEKGNLDQALASIRQVYLHELGHCLGLTEWELDTRNI